MSADVLCVDHPVIAVASLEQSRTVYRRLGFTIPPRGTHLEWGTGNWCIMFPEDYLELRGIVDSKRYTHHLDEHLARNGEGLMGLAFAPRVSATDSERHARAAGLAPKGVKTLTRRFELEGGDAFPSFDILYLDPADTLGLMNVVICEHKTPEIIRSPPWVSHANGVRQIARLVSVVDDPQALLERLARLLGAERLEWADGVLTARPDKGARVEFVSQGRAREEGLALQGKATPYLSTLTLLAPDLRKTVAALEKGEVRFAPTDGRLVVGPEQTCGLILEFVDRYAGR